jgi:proteasome lid subunit RPN8/RPN11
MSEEFKKQNKNNTIDDIDQESQHKEEHSIDEEKEEKIGKPVIIKAEAYKTIILYSSRYANKFIPAKDWREIYGILIGYADDDFVYIEKAEALTYGHATNVQLDEKHYGFIEQIQEKLEKNEATKGYYMIGWFHSHPGLGLFFSYIDLINQLGFQARNDDFCGLVFDHTLLGKKKQEIVKGTEHKITKYDTGFEIYRITDVNMDINDSQYDNNYHKVEYIVDGLNKFFFANVLSELSALVSAGKPLQSAYGEHYELESSNKKKEIKKESLVEIPISDDIEFDVDDFFYGNISKKVKKKTQLKEEAEQFIYEGNQAFEERNAFMGVEKYQQGIKIYKELKDNDRVFALLRNLSEHCISSYHHVLAKDFSEELYKLSEKYNNLFYRAEANYLIGYLALKEGEKEDLESALKKVQKASIDYEKAGDFAGAGKCYHRIGTIYHSRLNKLFNACLFYEQAIRSFNEALLKGHPLRTSIWSKSELLSEKIIELRDVVEELIPKIENPEEKKKIREDLNSIRLNF